MVQGCDLKRIRCSCSWMRKAAEEHLSRQGWGGSSPASRHLGLDLRSSRLLFLRSGGTVDALHPPPSSPCIFGSLFSPRCPRRGAQVLQLVLLAFQSFQPTCWWPHLRLLVLILCGTSSCDGGLCGHTARAPGPSLPFLQLCALEDGLSPRGGAVNAVVPQEVLSISHSTN